MTTATPHDPQAPPSYRDLMSENAQLQAEMLDTARDVIDLQDTQNRLRTRLSEMTQVMRGDLKRCPAESSVGGGQCHFGVGHADRYPENGRMRDHANGSVSW